MAQLMQCLVVGAHVGNIKRATGKSNISHHSLHRKKKKKTDSFIAGTSNLRPSSCHGATIPPLACMGKVALVGSINSLKPQNCPCLPYGILDPPFFLYCILITKNIYSTHTFIYTYIYYEAPI